MRNLSPPKIFLLLLRCSQFSLFIVSFHFSYKLPILVLMFSFSNFIFVTTKMTISLITNWLEDLALLNLSISIPIQKKKIKFYVKQNRQSHTHSTKLPLFCGALERWLIGSPAHIFFLERLIPRLEPMTYSFWWKASLHGLISMQIEYNK